MPSGESSSKPAIKLPKRPMHSRKSKESTISRVDARLESNDKRMKNLESKVDALLATVSKSKK